MSSQERGALYTHARGFTVGAIAACGAVTFTNPWEVVKTRLQLQGELESKAVSATHKQYSSATSAFAKIFRNEGLSGLQKGLAPAYAYQVLLNGTRLGAYEPIRDLYKSFFAAFGQTGAGANAVSMVGSGATSGILGAFIASPLFLIKTRMQSYSPHHAVGHQHTYITKGTIHSLLYVYRHEGIAGLWRGVDAAMIRTGVGSSVQLSSYDFCKKAIIDSKVFDRWGGEGKGNAPGQGGVLVHFAASAVTSLFVCLAMNPFDVVMTRMYNQHVGTDGKKGSLYTSGLDCIVKTVRAEGFGALYKGFTAHYLRIGILLALFPTTFHFPIFAHLRLISGMVVSPSAELVSLATEVGVPLTSKAFAKFLDEERDELRDLKLRDEFLFPKVSTIRDTALRTSKVHAAGEETLKPVDDLDLDSDAVYMIGNSLGLQPKRTRKLLNEELDVWAERGVNGHFDHPHGRPWVSVDDNVIEESAKLVGAKPEDVAIMNSLTANLHFLMVAFYKPTPDRYKIIMEAKAFPSDYFALSSQAQFHGYDPKEAVIEIAPREGESTLRLEDILEVIEKEGEKTALVLFSGIQYYSGQFFNLREITKAGHAKGCMVGFDLAHAAGNVPLKLHDWDVDFACWCTYKYLNAGPGGIGGAFVHQRHARSPINRFAGWWGTDPSTKFAMDNIFRAIPGAAGYRLSNPSVVSTISLLGSLQVFARTSIDALREKSFLLTAYLELLLDSLESKKFRILTPRDPFQRGCQLSLFFEGGIMEDVFQKLSVQGVLADERRPDVIRISPAPLYCTFADVWRCVEALKVALK
ncbi:hypothetical protein HDU97_002580 [Phlyctochytrium planicorne]|nr:hypothetical protein HDU97_002580 [Phlyctochytrium planicorne]